MNHENFLHVIVYADVRQIDLWMPSFSKYYYDEFIKILFFFTSEYVIPRYWIFIVIGTIARSTITFTLYHSTVVNGLWWFKNR